MSCHMPNVAAVERNNIITFFLFCKFLKHFLIGICCSCFAACEEPGSLTQAFMVGQCVSRFRVRFKSYIFTIIIGRRPNQFKSSTVGGSYRPARPGMFLLCNVSFLFVSFLENFHHFGCVMGFFELTDGWSWLKRTHLVCLLPVRPR